MGPYLSVLIPAYNEEDRLPQTLHKIFQFLQKQPWSWEIIAVDDGSKDGTVKVVQNLAKQIPLRLIQLPQNKGKGAAVREGVLATEGKYVLFSDADLATPIEEIYKLLSEVTEEKYLIVIGSRALQRSLVRQNNSFLRDLAGKFFGLCGRFLLGLNIRDTQCGFKIFERNVAHLLFSKQKLNGVVFDMEILYLAKKEGYNVKEVPVIWEHNFNTRIPYNFSKSIAVFLDLVRIKIFHG
ncbi:MAG: hypothetical protein A3I11_02235 [Elusimicrobia bacterium RIFCSPLOWO2_02_FULL_39_32]|nr:MAG: hypothetical protein A2034_01005 [Elusimicrobia bacterium GWA2_38_7]OGR78438.1 MAG: hypothetical protein A3B80_07120 [Elusimicrobia bacterium RIFCSPHIGHO2_02_FULL_39_36]OGR92197.1 MAG: hypothetical protein A3I11_02235 [Elusimicrobia bacterium RIFCSPLOWO2_02_FULL_39_32]OGR99936.1 MAG: hypothetical protein A3G85_03205 [Elusimicrobia bacterium RIFCSPLOWO2_12_FULL_39_28]